MRIKDNIIMKHGVLEVDIELSESLNLPVFPHVVGLLGENGIGKSTFFNYCKLNQKILFKNKLVAFLDQSPLKPLGDLTGHDLFLMMEEEFANRLNFKDRSEFLLIEKFDFTKKLETPIKNLSGGENQLLKLLTLFYLKSDYYFLDEPSNHLDIKKMNLLKDWLKELKKSECRLTLMMIDHNRGFLDEVCDEFLELNETGERDGNRYFKIAPVLL